MATNCVSVHGTYIALEPSLDGKEPTAFKAVVLSMTAIRCLLHVRTVRLSLRKAVSKKVYRQGFGNRCRATPRADIWIPRPHGLCLSEKERLTRRGLLKDIAPDFALLRLRVPEYPAGRARGSLNS